MNQDGVATLNRKFTTSETNLRKVVADLRREIHVHLEAGELAPWAAAVLAPLVQRVVCSHPRDNVWIAKDGDKCDRVDAFKLAELLRLNRSNVKESGQKRRRINIEMATECQAHPRATYR
jgi:hypothetical protein